MVAGSKSRSSSSNYTSSRHIRNTGTSGLVNTGSATYLQKQRASETIDNIKAAVIAFATAKAKEFLNQAFPGFESYVREAQSNRSTSHLSSAGEYNQGDYKQGSGGAFGSVQQTEGEGEGVNYSQNDGRQHSSHDPSQRNYSTERTYGNS